MKPTEFSLFLQEGNETFPIVKLGTFYSVVQSGNPSKVTYHDLGIAIAQCSVWLDKPNTSIMVKLATPGE